MLLFFEFNFIIILIFFILIPGVGVDISPRTNQVYVFGGIIPLGIRARVLSLARSKLRLCSANHRPGYWSNLPCDWPITAWAYPEQETENGTWTSHVVASLSPHANHNAPSTGLHRVMKYVLTIHRWFEIVGGCKHQFDYSHFPASFKRNVDVNLECECKSDLESKYAST